MESIPCSNVGHIYRSFDRFAVDDLLDKSKIGTILDRNDMRVAEVSRSHRRHEWSDNGCWGGICNKAHVNMYTCGR